jgi:hypothetical protein
MRAPPGRLGMDLARQDDHVQSQPSREGRDPPNGDDHTLASTDHQPTVDDDPEQFLVGLHGTS